MANPISLGIQGGFLLLSVLIPLLFPVKRKQEGPRLENLDVSQSTYGGTLVWGRGTFRAAGQVIWVRNNKIQEVVTTETQGAKGGPQIETTTYSYYGSFAVAFTSRQIVGIQKVLLNRKVVFNITGSASEETVQNSHNWAGKYCRFYTGNPSQAADPLIQAVLGQAPAYRFCSFMVFENLPLAELGNTLPQVEAEVVVDGHWHYQPQLWNEDFRYPPRLFRSDVLLSDLVNELCLFAGLQVGEWDSSELAQIALYGYVQTGVKSVSAILEELRTIYFFDIVEGEKIYFRRRQRNGIVCAIPHEFLAAHDGDSTRPVDYRIKQQNPPQLPVEISITFRDPDKRFQQGIVYARRQGDSYFNKISVTTTTVLYKDQAQAIADRYLAEIWSEPETFTFNLPLGYMPLEANDVINVELVQGQYELIKITKVAIGANGILEITGVNGAYSLIPLDLQGNLAPTEPEDPVFAEPITDLAILDIPLIRSTDTEMGLYAIASGNERWRSAALYGSVNSATGYQFAGNLLYSSKYGSVAIATPVRTPEIIDRSTILRVKMQTVRMALYSVSIEEMLEGQNLILVGNEVMAYQTANQVDADEYDLSTLLRGLKGTEWAVNTHVANERFVFLSGYCQRVPLTRDRLGQTGYWKAPTPGQALDEVNAVTAAYTGVDLKPYSPVQLAAEKVGTDYLLTWIRRDRKGYWYDYTDADLSETFEQYKITIWANATGLIPRGQYESSTPSFLYTASALGGDFTVVPSEFWVSVQQFSTVVGYGYNSERIKVNV